MTKKKKDAEVKTEEVVEETPEATEDEFEDFEEETEDEFEDEFEDEDGFEDFEEEDEVVAEVEDEFEGEEEIVEEATVPKKTQKGKKGKTAEKGKRKERKKIEKPVVSVMQKAVNSMLKKAGLEELPQLEDLLGSNGFGTKTKIADLAIFLNEPDSELLKLIQSECPVANTVNCSASVDLKLVKKVGHNILTAGRIFQPMTVAKVEDGSLQVTSGRHRLTFLAMLYGTSAKIPVIIQDMSLVEARNAVVFSNQARSTKALEKADHVVLQACHGNLELDLEERYEVAVRNKTTMKRFVTFHVVANEEISKVSFAVGDTRKDGALTTYSGLEGFWGNAIQWHSEMTYPQFEKDVKKATRFINAVVKAMEACADFDSKQQMSTQALTAVGAYYASLTDSGVNVQKVADKIGEALVKMGEIGREKSEVIKSGLVRRVSKAVKALDKE